MTTNPDGLAGAFGAAHRIPATNFPDNKTTLDAWIITAPYWHPLWSQYVLAVITLADLPGVPPAHKERPDVTHQVLVMTLDPNSGPYDAATVTELHFLQPGNIAAQFTTTDDQARDLAPLCVRAVVDGLLTPETADAPAKTRAAWRQVIHQTLEHHRDPHHGRLN
jgi:hypothetical protein